MRNCFRRPTFEFLSVIFFLVGTNLPAYSQPEEFEVTNSGVAPIAMAVDIDETNVIYAGALEVIKSYCDGKCQISVEENKSIKVDALQQMAFKAVMETYVLNYDVRFTLVVRISKGRIDMEYRVGAISCRGRLVDFTYQDFFKKDGTVKKQHIRAKQDLEQTINLLPNGIYEHLKKNYSIPKLVDTDMEKGYMRGNIKIGVWQYMDSNKGVELKIDHTDGKVIYQRPDSSAYFIERDGSVEKTKLDVRPMPLAGFRNFYESVKLAFSNADNNTCNNYNKRSLVATFDVNRLGEIRNWDINHGTSQSSCDSLIVARLSEIKMNWIPAERQNQKFVSQFAIPVILQEERSNSSSSAYDSHLAKANLLDSLVLKFPNPDDQIYTVVDQQPEFPGGMEEMMRFIVKTMKYPADARRAGHQGRLFVGFVVERNGEITNIQVVKGFDKDCEAEGMRVISAMPMWIPGKENGIPVRVRFLLPVNFKLAK